MTALLLLPLLLGCPKKGGAPPYEPPIVLDQGIEEAPLGEAIGPGTWVDPSGILSLEVPPSWTGRTGPPAGSLVLTLEHAASGVQIQVWEFAASGQVGPRPRPGCEWMFTDDGRHRTVPVLVPAITATCLADDPRAPVIQGWYGRVRGREVHVEVIYPAGRIVEGRAVVEPLLGGLVPVGSAAPAPGEQGG